MYFTLFLNMWKMNRLTAAQVDAAVTAGRITFEDGVAIKATAR